MYFGEGKVPSRTLLSVLSVLSTEPFHRIHRIHRIHQRDSYSGLKGSPTLTFKAGRSSFSGPTTRQLPTMEEIPVPPRPFTEDNFIELGLNIDYKANEGSWRNNSKERQIEKFVSSYRAHPKALERIWCLTQVTPYPEDRIDDTIEPVHFLVAYRWMNTYESELELHKHFGIPEKKIRHWCKIIPETVAALRKLLVSTKLECAIYD